jgi:hypothetical protein
VSAGGAGDVCDGHDFSFHSDMIKSFNGY